MPLVLDGTTGINLPTGSEIDISSGNLTIDVASNIILDSDSGTVQLKDNGTEYVQFYKNGNNVQMTNTISDGDIIFRGNDGGSMTNALTLDISNLGFAFFNANAFFNESASDVDFRIKSVNETNMFYVDASTNRIGIGTDAPNKRLHIIGNSTDYPLSLDSTNTDYAMEFRRNGTSEWWLKASANSFQIHENGGGDYFTVASGGVVGIGTTGATSSGYDTSSKKLAIASMALNNATSGYLELSSRANTAGYNAGAIQFNNAENAGTAGTGTQNRTVGQIRTVITTTDSNAGDDSGGTMQFWTKPEAQALANTMRISTDDPNHRVDVTADATQLAGDGGTNANAFFSAKAKGNYYAGLDIKSNSGHVGGWIGHWNGSSTSRALQARVGGNGLNASDYIAIKADYLGRVTKPSTPAFMAKGNNAAYITTSPIQFPTVEFNIGNHYNNSNMTFTAPIAGRYFFHAHIGLVNGGSGNQIYPWFSVNGSQVMYTYQNFQTTWYSSAHLTCIFNLSANDTVQVTLSVSGATYYNGQAETRFMGYLLG